MTESRSGPEFLGLSRCAACYNQKASAMPRRGGDWESSSSGEDSCPEVDSESEAESSSDSSCSGHVAAETPERRSPVCGDAAEPESRGEDGDGQGETGEASERLQDKNGTQGAIRRAPLVRSFSPPPSLTPHLTPLSLLPCPAKVVSTLHLQVLPEEHTNDAFFAIRRHLSEREDEKTEESCARGGAGHTNNLLLPQPFQWQQMGLPWQQVSQPTLQEDQYYYQQQQQQQQQHWQMSYQYQQQPPQHFPPLTAQGQVLHPPTLHTPLWAPNAPPAHLHALTPQPCWYCYHMHLPSTY
ncbi:PH domain-containing protein DDB_G0275795-like [Xiphias gladius]|uniref:PH domain-containing protein DDB_G0275795-like n=1 Tax=Xiphias gladius TaxID=8245 RepID=UPI001A97F20F|nr:PH domain-containing protein DDB_G0275795-like [Xiphias gladius]